MRVDFDHGLHSSAVRGAQISSDGGLLGDTTTSLDDALGPVGPLRQRRLAIPAPQRTPSSARGPVSGSPVFGRLARYETSTMPTVSRFDPVMRTASTMSCVGRLSMRKRPRHHRWGGSKTRDGWPLAENGRCARQTLNGQWIDRFHDRNGLKFIVLDMEQLVSPTMVIRKGTAWNGQILTAPAYHPILLVNQFRHAGNACHPARWNQRPQCLTAGNRIVLDPDPSPITAKAAKPHALLRADAAYAIPAIYARLEKTG